MTARSSAGQASTDGWREAYQASGKPRPLYGPILRALERVDLASLKAGVAQRMQASGATFSTDLLDVCPVPRLIESAEWAALSIALAQRVRALSAFVVDAYGARAIVSAGIVPAAVIDDAKGYEPELRGRWPDGPASLGVVGLDVVRDCEGELLILEDNTRTPSGFTYAVAARHAVTAAIRAIAPALDSATRTPVPLEEHNVAALCATLQDAAEAVHENGSRAANIVVLTGGSSSCALFEHTTAARWLNAPVVTIEHLERRGDELWHRAGDACSARRRRLPSH
ncbi:MAG: circularly permuted type 2 ATP-grasp protein [Solirubrobacteraceae bacterium]